VEEDCLAELRATGARPRRPALSGLDALTESERRVARHAAAGRSNPDIAQSLFVTVKTVEAHLARAYRKLGICSRGELATALSGLDDQRDRAVAD
jgi:DNA-binding NarL/FixJ family response regulator